MNPTLLASAVLVSVAVLLANVGKFITAAAGGGGIALCIRDRYASNMQQSFTKETIYPTAMRNVQCNLCYQCSNTYIHFNTGYNELRSPAIADKSRDPLRHLNIFKNLILHDGCPYFPRR